MHREELLEEAAACRDDLAPHDEYEFWKEAVRKLDSSDPPRPKIPPLVSATLNFANTGIFTAPAERDATKPSAHLSVLQRDVKAQLEAVAADGTAVDLDHVDCSAGSVLHEYALERGTSFERTLC